MRRAGFGFWQAQPVFHGARRQRGVAQRARANRDRHRNGPQFALRIEAQILVSTRITATLRGVIEECVAIGTCFSDSSEPMLPPAPLRLSTTICRSNCWAMLQNPAREEVVPPPGGYGTTSVMFLRGACAWMDSFSATRIPLRPSTERDCEVFISPAPIGTVRCDLQLCSPAAARLRRRLRCAAPTGVSRRSVRLTAGAPRFYIERRSHSVVKAVGVDLRL